MRKLERFWKDGHIDIFEVVSTIGLPIDMTVQTILDKGEVPHLGIFRERAEKAGWHNRTIDMYLKEAREVMRDNGCES